MKLLPQGQIAKPGREIRVIEIVPDEKGHALVRIRSDIFEIHIMEREKHGE